MTDPSDPTPAERRLAKIYEANYRAYGRAEARAMGGWVLEEDGVEVMACPWVNVFNGLFPPRWSDADTPGKLRTALRLYQRTGQGMFVLVGPSANARALRPLLLQFGFRCSYWVPYMHLDFGDLKARDPAPPGVRVVRVEDFDFFQDHPHPWIGPPTTARRRARLAFWRDLCSGTDPRGHQFVAWRDGGVLGGAALFLHRGHAAVYDVTVGEQHRRQGIGSLIVYETCRFARDLGLGSAVLSASGPGVGLYEGVGFRLAGRYGSYFLGSARVARLRLDPSA